MNKAKADLVKAHGVYVKAQEEMYRKVAILQQECNNELRKLLKIYGYKGAFTPSSLNFHGGILVKDWEIGTYMVCEYQSDKEERFLLALREATPAFYRKFGIKIILRSLNGHWITFPE